MEESSTDVAVITTPMVREHHGEATGTLDGADLAQVLQVLRQIKGMIRYVDTARDATLLVRRSHAVRRVIDEALKSCRLLDEQQFELKQEAAEAHLRTQRRGGELLGALMKHPGGRPPKARTGPNAAGETAPTLRELGIGRNESHRWQRIAGIPLESFEEHIAERRKNGWELTTSGALQLASRMLGSQGDLIDLKPKPSSAPALLVEYDKARRQVSEMLWLDPLALVVPMDSERRRDELEFVSRFRLWLTEFELALKGRPSRPTTLTG